MVDGESLNSSEDILESLRATQFLESFEAHQSKAKEALFFSQATQQRIYNCSHLNTELEEGD